MTLNKSYFLLAIIIVFVFGLVTNAFAQGGGKAMPKRIKFAKGKSSKTISGRLRSGEQQEYVIKAKKGQKLQVKIISKPRGKYHSFSILGIDGVDFATDFDTNYSIVKRLPESGDYLIIVKKLTTRKDKSARYYLTVKIMY